MTHDFVTSSANVNKHSLHTRLTAQKMKAHCCKDKHGAIQCPEPKALQANDNEGLI